MKSKLLLLTALVFIALRTSAQTGNLIVFTEGGEKFSLVLNGVLQNATPEPNVKVTDLPASTEYPTAYKMRIIFADAAFGTHDFTTAVDNGVQRTMTIKKNKKGEYVQRMVSDVPLAQAPATSPTQVVHVYSTTPAPPASITTTSTTISKTTTTTSGQPANENVNINMGVNAGETGGAVNISISGTDQNMSGTSQTTTTRTTTTTTSGYDTPPSQPHPAPRSYVEGYTGPIGCPVPMSQKDFNDFTNSVSSKSFEESKLTIAKQALNNNCLITSQVKEVMLLFTFEQTRLDFAKYAYTRTHDVGNYFKINDAFTFESSIDDLNSYIGNNR